MGPIVAAGTASERGGDPIAGHTIYSYRDFAAFREQDPPSRDPPEEAMTP